MKRNRDREDAGKHARSDIKQDLIKKAAFGQVAMFQATHPAAKVAIVDGNANDGEGVPLRQLGLFEENRSFPTAEIVASIVTYLGNADGILCEKNPQHRAKLQAKYPGMRILSDHADAAAAILPQHIYGLWISDPCGGSDQGIKAMQEFGRLIPRSDYVIVYNEGWVRYRLRATTSPRWAPHRALYLPTLEPDFWFKTLNRRHMARTPLIKGSPNFHYRVLIVANWLSQAAQRRPFEVVR